MRGTIQLTCEDPQESTADLDSGRAPVRAEDQKPAAPARLQQIDGLRGIAMLFVFVGHFGTVWSNLVHPDGAARFYLRLVDADATLGSSFFMLLSGFFAYGSLMRGKKTFGEFLRGRIWRLYPLFLIMTLVYIVGSLVFPKMSKLPANPYDAAIFIVETLLLLPGLIPARPLMDVTWTLSFIVLFYFIEAALARLFKFWQLSRLTRFVVLTSGGVLWAMVGVSTGYWVPRTAVFWAGMALSEAIEGMSGKRFAWATRMVAPAVAITILGVWLRTDLALRTPDSTVLLLLQWRFVITAITLAAFVWVAYFGPSWWKALLSGRYLGQLGAASYSFYLTHGFAIKVLRFGIIPKLGDAASNPIVFWTCQAFGLALAIGIARIAYVLVERPMSNLLPVPTSNKAGADRLPNRPALIELR